MVILGDHTKLQNKNIMIKNYDRKILENGLPQLNWIGCAIGSSGNGKSTAIVNLINEACKQKAFDQIFLFSPSSYPNKFGLVAEKKFDLLEKYNIPFHRYPYYDKSTMDDCEAKIDELMKAYLDYKNYKAIYMKMLFEPDKLLDHEFNILNQHDFQTPKNPNPTGNDLHPCTLVVLDDLAGDARQSKRLDAWVSRIRHNNANVISCNQYLKQVSPTCRKNANFCLIWKNADSKYMKDIHQEFCSDIPFTEFQNMLNLLTERYHFLFIDNREPKGRKYRFNFDQYLIPDEL